MSVFSPVRAGVVGMGPAARPAGGRAALAAARARHVEPAAAGAARGPGAGRAGDAAGRAGGRAPQVRNVPALMERWLNGR